MTRVQHKKEARGVPALPRKYPHCGSAGREYAYCLCMSPLQRLSVRIVHPQSMRACIPRKRLSEVIHSLDSWLKTVERSPALISV